MNPVMTNKTNEFYKYEGVPMSNDNKFDKYRIFDTSGKRSSDYVFISPVTAAAYVLKHFDPGTVFMVGVAADRVIAFVYKNRVYYTSERING